MAERSARRRLDQPAGPSRRLRLDIDIEYFGRLAERLARFLGTGTYLLWQTILVIVWILLNIFAVALQWDPYPFILLNLAFSTQAAYAAPLILLAQNRQDDRDRVALDEDRARATRTNAETEYLAREIAGVRLAVNEVVTRDFLRSELERGEGRGERGDRRGLDRDTQKALGRAVDRAVDRAVERAVTRVAERTVEQAVEQAVRRVLERDPGPDGVTTRPTTGPHSAT